jgi:hypothetical protein
MWPRLSFREGHGALQGAKGCRHHLPPRARQRVGAAMFVFGLRPSTIDSMSEGSLSRVWEMPAIAPMAQNRR